jgi:hypothetical protein
MDVLQKLDLARPDPALGVEIDPDAQGRQRLGGGFLHRSGFFLTEDRFSLTAAHIATGAFYEQDEAALYP